MGGCGVQSSAPLKQEDQDPQARASRRSWRLNVGRRRRSHEKDESEEEELFPGFVEEKKMSPRKESRTRPEDAGGAGRAEGGLADPPGCTMSVREIKRVQSLDRGSPAEVPEKRAPWECIRSFGSASP